MLLKYALVPAVLSLAGSALAAPRPISGSLMVSRQKFYLRPGANILLVDPGWHRHVLV